VLKLPGKTAGGLMRCRVHERASERVLAAHATFLGEPHTQIARPQPANYTLSLHLSPNPARSPYPTLPCLPTSAHLCQVTLPYRYTQIRPTQGMQQLLPRLGVVGVTAGRL
jgi:hypothetical protein